MITVSKEELTGYRQPTGTESTCIKKRLLYEINRSGRIGKVGITVFSVIAAMTILNSPSYFSEGKIKEGFFSVVMAVLSTGILLMLRYYSVHRRMLRRAIEQESFRVMDCWGYEADLEKGSDQVNAGGVRVYNRQEQYCTEWMLTDQDSSRDVKNNEKVHFLLLRCEKADGGKYFKLLSDRILQAEMKNK